MLHCMLATGSAHFLVDEGVVRCLECNSAILTTVSKGEFKGLQPLGVWIDEAATIDDSTEPTE